MRISDCPPAEHQIRRSVPLRFSPRIDGIPRRLTFVLLVWLTLSFVNGPAQAQPLDPELSPECAALVERLTAQSRARKAEAIVWALCNDMPIYENDGRQVRELMAVWDGRPVYYTTTNVESAIAVATDQVRDVLPWDLDGEGLRVGVWDEGIVRRSHPEFMEPDGQSRVAARDSVTISPHATHVAGTIGAAGIDPEAKGMAPRAGIESYDWDEDTAQMTAYTAKTPGQHNKIYVSNHSYGLMTGWVLLGPNRLSDRPAWYWPGIWAGPDSYDDWFGQYNFITREWDEVAYFSRYYLAFAAAGNDRGDAPEVGEKVFYYVPVVGWLSTLYSLDTCPAGDGVVNGGFGTVSGPAGAKNIMTVGAVGEAVSDETRSCVKATMTTFSCWGPTDDGRIKPDIVATGVNVYSTAYDPNNPDVLYETHDGTSMATPSATGSAALLVQLYERLFPGQDMRASTLKGLILHTADDLGRPGPDYCYGWGLMNTRAAAELIQRHYDSAPRPLLFEGLLNDKNPSDSYYFYADGTTPIRVTLCWTDPPAPATNKHDDRTPKLLNDLDLRLIGPGGTPTYYPYILDPADPCAVASPGDNKLDNVEQVYLATPGEAGVYEIRISYKNTLTDREQNYALVSSAAFFDPRRPIAEDAQVVTAKNVPVAIPLKTREGGLPGVFPSVITSAPRHGTLEGPDGNPIAPVPARIPSGGQVFYRPAADFVGDDSLSFYADDGGPAPTGGSPNTAVITLSVRDLVQREYPVGAADDDVMAQSPGGTLVAGSTLLRLGQRIIGTRFRQVEIPNGAEIASAHLQLYAGVTEKSTATIQAQATGDAVGFALGQNSPRTQASVAWNWQGDEPENMWYSSPDLRQIIQEVVNRPDWSSGNALVLIYDGKNTLGSGTFFSAWEADPQRAAKLQITYLPAAGAGAGQKPGKNPPTAVSGTLYGGVGMPMVVTLEATDDGLPGPLAFTLRTLPGHGSLEYPNGTPIAQPIALVGGADRVIYRPQTGFAGDDSFAFYADDGGNAPSGGPSAPATMTLKIRNMATRAYQVLADTDDAYGADGSPIVVSTVLSVGQHASAMRFRNVDLSRADEIVSARLEICMETTAVAHEIRGTLQGEAAGNAGDFARPGLRLASLPRTQAAVPWDWAVGAVWPHETFCPSPDIAGIVQEIVDRADWQSGNALVVLYGGNAYAGQNLQFFACDGWCSPRAARLRIVYVPSLSDMEPPRPAEPNAPPEPNAPAEPSGTPPTAQDATFETLFATALTITLAATDDGLPKPPGKLTYAIASLPSHGTLEYLSGGQITQAGTVPNGSKQVVYRPQAAFQGQDSFTFCADDGGTSPSGGKSSPATIRITVKAPLTQTFTLQLQINEDEDNTYADLGSPWNHLFPNHLEVGLSTSAMRFKDIPIPPGSTIIHAYLKIFSERHLAEPVEALIQAQANGNPPPFGAKPLVTDLPRTAASAVWNWPRGPNSYCADDCWRTSPDIAAIIQEIVNRSDWSAGNAIVITYSGTSTPTQDLSFCAYATCCGCEGYAPKLDITYGY
jgi:hypothetical protein